MNKSTRSIVCALVIACAPSLLYAQTFAEQFNPSGDPVGGGPGYAQIPDASAADHTLGASSTAADLLALAKSYYDEAAGRTVTPASAAAQDALIWVDPAAVIDLDGYNRITFAGGVTLASNRGAERGGGTYARGALLKRLSMWPNTENGAQLDAMFMGWNGGRLTGFRARGPYDLHGVNSMSTPGWLGGAAFFIKRRVSGTFELDNNEIYAWPDFAVLWYHTTTGDAMHHNWVHHNRQSGWGYGLYPGRPFNAEDEVIFLTEYNLFQENRHSTDHNSARPNSWHNLNWTVRGNVYLGEHGQAIIHAHNNDVGGCRYAGWKTDFTRNMILQPGDKGEDFNQALPPPGGYLSVKDLYLDRSTRERMYITKVPGDQIDPNDTDWLPDCGQPHGEVTSFDVHTNLEGATIPTEGSVPSATTLSEGQALTLGLSGSSDPDGHAIVYHEILWGDGKSVTDPAHREIVYGPLAEHTYTKSGTYIVRVTAFNEHGIPSRETYHNLIVEPAASDPLFVAFVGTDWPGQEGQNWPGYFSARLLVNGHVAMGWRDVATFDGYERITWDASPIDPDTTLEITMELRTDQTISDPGGAEPGDVEVYVDRFYLFGRTGALYNEDLFFSDDDVGAMIRTWGGGGSSSLFDHHDRAIGPGYGYALTVPQDSWTGYESGDLYTFTTNAKDLDASDEQPAPPAGLLAWYPMEEAGATTTRADAYSTVDLKVGSGKPVRGAVPGVQGNAVDMGSGGRLHTRKSAPAAPLDVTQDFTVASWVYVPAGETDSGVIWGALNGGSYLRLKTVPWKDRYAFTFPVASAAPAREAAAVEEAAREYDLARVWSNDLARDTWQMVTVRYDAAATTVRLRVDGNPDVEKALPGPIGAGEGNDWWWINGGGLRVDEQSVWQTYLADEAVAWLYNEGAGRTYSDLDEGWTYSNISSTALTRGPVLSGSSEAPGVSSSAVMLIQAEGLEEGQRVSAWVPGRGQVGEGVVQSNNIVAITIRGDEPVTADVIEGARPGEPIVLKLHPGGQEEPRHLTVSSLRDMLSGERTGGPLLYRDDALYTVHVEELPQAFRLGKNYPNPFSRSTTIEYSLPEKARVELVVYDVLGRRVAELVNEEQKAGIYRIEFIPVHISSGVYFYRLRAGDFTDSGKMTLVR